MSKTISLLSALLCTFIWGTTFIAQDTGMDNIGPFTFNSVRFFVGFLAVSPFVLLFEPVDRITAAAIKSEIRDTILNFEPRVKLQDVNVSTTSDDLGYKITVSFSVIGINVPPQELSLSLESTR